MPDDVITIADRLTDLVIKQQTHIVETQKALLENEAKLIANKMLVVDYQKKLQAFRQLKRELASILGTNRRVQQLLKRCRYHVRNLWRYVQDGASWSRVHTSQKWLVRFSGVRYHDRVTQDGVADWLLKVMNYVRDVDIKNAATFEKFMTEFHARWEPIKN